VGLPTLLQPILPMIVPKLVIADHMSVHCWIQNYRPCETFPWEVLKI